MQRCEVLEGWSAKRILFIFISVSYIKGHAYLDGKGAAIFFVCLLEGDLAGA